MLQCKIPDRRGKVQDLQKRVRVGVRYVDFQPRVGGLIVEADALSVT